MSKKRCGEMLLETPVVRDTVFTYHTPVFFSLPAEPNILRLVNNNPVTLLEPRKITANHFLNRLDIDNTALKGAG